jgi:hypothetical protein
VKSAAIFARPGFDSKEEHISLPQNENKEFLSH